MIKGIGIDMIEPERVATRIKKKKGFRELVFSKNEIAYCEKKTNKFEHYAARFAAKEAFFKAIGTGWGKPPLLKWAWERSLFHFHILKQWHQPW